MERTEWLAYMRRIVEELYDAIAPRYWVSYGFYPNQTHLEFLEKILKLLPAHSHLLSAACGAGRYDGLLRDAGHTVLGIDQSEGMLQRAREMVPGVRYERIGLQEMDFDSAFDGAICLDAMENIPPEHWPEILGRFARALRPGGLLYFTVERPDSEQELIDSYERARQMGLPVVPGELADKVEAAYKQMKRISPDEIPDELSEAACYHYYPPAEQVQAWLAAAGFEILEQGSGHWYEHALSRKISASLPR